VVPILFIRPGQSYGRDFRHTVVTEPSSSCLGFVKNQDVAGFGELSGVPGGFQNRVIVFDLGRRGLAETVMQLVRTRG
jgi:hypothetical protein